MSTDEHGQVIAVEIAPDWREHLEPRELGGRLLQEFHHALARALMTPPERAAPSQDTPDLRAWGGDPGCLVDEALTDVRRLRAALRRHRTSEATARSTDRHVWGRTVGVAVAELGVDVAWAARAHRLDIQAESLEILCRLQAAAAPARLVDGPASDAAQVLARLGRDPQAIVRAAGLT